MHRLTPTHLEAQYKVSGFYKNVAIIFVESSVLFSWESDEVESRI